MTLLSPTRAGEIAGEIFILMSSDIRILIILIEIYSFTKVD